MLSQLQPDWHKTPVWLCRQHHMRTGVAEATTQHPNLPELQHSGHEVENELTTILTT